MKKILLFLPFFLFSSLLSAQSSRIFLDEDFSDWQDVPTAHTDPLADGGSSGIDFGRLWISNDEDFVFFRLEVGKEINLQDFNNITIYLDADNDATTGFESEGIGAEIVYNFGDRSGVVYANGSSILVKHSEIGLNSSPTVSSDQFEIAISRDLTFFGQSIFQSNTIQVRFDNVFSGEDRLPDLSGGIAYTFNEGDFDPLPEFSIQRAPETSLRILSYNVQRDDFFENGLQENYRRILQAIQPDIIGFQEIYDHTSAQTAAKVESFLPSGTGEEWYHTKIDPDIIVVSRFPVLESKGTNAGDYGNGAFLIDLDPISDKQLMFLVAHLPCCDNNEDRQDETDALMAFVRNAKDGTGPFALDADDPIVVVGDMNLVGDHQQQTTLLTGDIVAEFVYGADFNPDWDGSAFKDAKPFATNLPLTTTWYDEGSAFSPGRLDYIAYTGSVLELKNTYSLFTRALSDTDLADNHLEKDDAILASDHLPQVADFKFKFTTTAKNLESSQMPSLQIFPNPVANQADIIVDLPGKSMLTMELFGLDGKLVSVLFHGEMASGKNALDLKAQQLANGSYLCRMTTEFGVVNSRVEVLR